MSRIALARQIVGLIGPEVFWQDAYTGWPSHVLVRGESGLQSVALHVSVVSPHSRQPWEWRFQNPASCPPVVAPNNSLPVLVGLDEIGGRPVLVVADGRSRLGRATRFGILFNKRISQEAANTGWSEQVSSSGERIYATWPRLFPLLVQILWAGGGISTKPIADAAKTSGLLDEDTTQARERARRTVASYVRDAKFSMQVKDAYGHRCAMCQVGLGLVAGAHIFPVSAPGSPDSIWNGMALCHNHHSAFDSHTVWISRDYMLRIDPQLFQRWDLNPESARFLYQTSQVLRVPLAIEERPRHDMLQARYNYYAEEYRWAPPF